MFILLHTPFQPLTRLSPVFFFNCWKPETALIKKDGAVFVIFSHRVHLPSLNEISLLWYCLLMEQFVWGWHFFAATGFMEPTISPASGCLLGCFFFLSKAPPFCSFSIDGLPAITEIKSLTVFCLWTWTRWNTTQFFLDHLMNLWWHLYAFSFELYNQIDWAGF